MLYGGPSHAWHPAIVHFPLAFLLASPLLELAGRVLRRGALERLGRLLLGLGLVLAVPAVITGLVAYARVEHDDAAHAIMIRHLVLEAAAVALFAAVALRRLLWRRPLGRAARATELGVALAAAALLAVGGHLGGRLVFEHAIGIDGDRLERILHDREGAHAH